jgi:hypothetical protein
VTKLKDLESIMPSSATNRISADLSKIRQKSFLIEVYLWFESLTIPPEKR